MGAAGDEEPSSLIERIYVSVRLRPLNEKEIARNDVSDWECINDNTVIYRNNLSVAERSMYPTAYTFDRVFSHDCTTRKVYEEGAKEVALSVVSGINSSVFAYGQTSSGKTYTMSGITEYAMADIYDYVEKHKEREFIMKFSAMEIYNESVRDLLSADSTPLRLLDDPERGTIVEKLTEETLLEWSHFKELLWICESQRQIGETSLNETSSRSHQILRLTIESSAREFSGNDTSCLTATVNFVDLAGSERASQALSAGTRLKEGCHINRSLLTLGTVIRKLSKGRNGHIPYRDSKLTRILQSSLGGNAKTAIICTLSPARSHVEQSRNTLLFASCAKEVTTNAQVNIVMTDKALVKHLQRELSRLENELRNSGKYPTTPDPSEMLREKDIEIEKLKREVAELTMQRDLARAQVEDVLREAGNRSNDRSPEASVDYQYPKLRVRNSWDSPKSVNPPFGNPDSLDISGRSSDRSQYSDGHSRNSSDDNFFQLPGFQENLVQSSSSREQEVSVSNFVGTDMRQDKREQNEKRLEDPYKDVRYVQMEGTANQYAESNKSKSSNGRHEDLDISSAKADPGISGLTEAERGDRQNEELRSPTSKEQKEWKSILPDFVSPSFKEPYPWLLEEDTAYPSSLKLTRSRSCRARLMTSLSLYPFGNDDKDENTPSIGFEKDYIGRPTSLQKKFSPLKYDVDNKNSSTNGSKNPAKSSAFDELKAQNVEPSDGAISNNGIGTLNLPMASDSARSINVRPLNLQMASEGAGSTTASTVNLQMEEVTDPQNEKQLAEDVDTKAKFIAPRRSVKDVGLDPIQDDLLNLWNWPSEFNRLQKEIFQLWHDCNVSLVHRTYFYLLFKGDPKDSIYMEVEHRRLSFLKDTFSRGNQTMEDGRTVTRASSLKALRQERVMLSQRMKKKFSKEQRHNLFLKWGVGLHTRHRRWKLVCLLWSDPKNMNHVAESASIVAKLVKFIKPDQAFKEMFGLNFAPRRSRRKFNLRSSVMSLL